MAIPDYQTLMLPLLRALEDGRDHSLRDVAVQLAQEFGITREEERELLPSGKQTVFLNRVGWARTYMKKAGLVEGWGRGQLRITEEGRVLAQAPERLDNAFLRSYPAFREWAGYRPPGQAATRASAGPGNSRRGAHAGGTLGVEPPDPARCSRP